MALLLLNSEMFRARSGRSFSRQHALGMALAPCNEFGDRQDRQAVDVGKSGDVIGDEDPTAGDEMVTRRANPADFSFCPRWSEDGRVPSRSDLRVADNRHGNSNSFRRWVGVFGKL